MACPPFWHAIPPGPPLHPTGISHEGPDQPAAHTQAQELLPLVLPPLGPLSSWSSRRRRVLPPQFPPAGADDPIAAAAAAAAAYCAPHTVPLQPSRTM